MEGHPPQGMPGLYLGSDELSTGWGEASRRQNNQQQDIYAWSSKKGEPCCWLMPKDSQQCGNIRSATLTQLHVGFSFLSPLLPFSFPVVIPSQLMQNLNPTPAGKKRINISPASVFHPKPLLSWFSYLSYRRKAQLCLPRCSHTALLTTPISGGWAEHKAQGSSRRRQNQRHCQRMGSWPKGWVRFSPKFWVFWCFTL